MTTQQAQIVVKAVFPNAMCMYRGDYCIYIDGNVSPIASGKTLEQAWLSAAKSITAKNDNDETNA